MKVAPAGLLIGRTVVVTGATGGIGKATAIGLARMGARVAIIGRDLGRSRAAGREIDAAGGEAHVFVGDMSSQTDVRRLAREMLQRLTQIDVVINNVGGYWSSRHVTDEGLERTFAVNHLAPFLLTNLLLDRLVESAPARVVSVSSNAHTRGRLDFDDLQGERSYSGAKAYSQSKLANVMFTYELDRRLAGSSVTANVLHPGVVRTSFGMSDPGHVQRMLVPMMRPFMKSTARGAATSILLASAPSLQHVTGKFFTGGSVRKSGKSSYDEIAAARLWHMSAELVRL